MPKIYTKTGDGGETSLLSGGRVSKDSARIEAYGTVDELNSVLGLLRSEPLPAETDAAVEQVQEVLFSLGAALADPKQKCPQDDSAWATEPLEEWIDAMERDLEPLKSFILPGGSRAAALAHLARTVCRRAER
jgi:cob(I)alamin adenosyltransferase